jgi:hypothetical protein
MRSTFRESKKEQGEDDTRSVVRESEKEQGNLLESCNGAVVESNLEQSQCLACGIIKGIKVQGMSSK